MGSVTKVDERYRNYSNAIGKEIVCKAIFEFVIIGNKDSCWLTRSWNRLPYQSLMQRTEFPISLLNGAQ